MKDGYETFDRLIAGLKTEGYTEEARREKQAFIATLDVNRNWELSDWGKSFVKEMCKLLLGSDVASSMSPRR
jgi:hypothetical protein